MGEVDGEESVGAVRLHVQRQSVDEVGAFEQIAHSLDVIGKPEIA